MSVALRLRPFLNKTRRALGSVRALSDVAAHSEVLQEAEAETCSPPICLPDDPERATHGATGPAGLAEHLAIARNDVLRHHAVVRHEIKDCLVHPGGIEARGASLLYARPRAAALLGPVRRLDRALYAETGATKRYFGHWLHDGCATALLARPGEVVLFGHGQGWSHAPDYLDALGIAPEPGTLFHVRRLSVVTDHGQGSLKRARYAEMRRRIDARWPGEGRARRICLRRGRSGAARLILDEDAVVEALAHRGFESVDLDAPAPALVPRFRAADLVVSLDGSHLAHAYLGLRPGARLVTLVPADRFTLVHAGRANAFGLRYGFLVVAREGQGYRLDLDRLDALLCLPEMARPSGETALPDAPPI